MVVLNFQGSPMKKIKVYTKGYCPYCTMAKNLLTKRGLPYEEIALDPNDPHFQETMEALIQRSGMRTVPQIFVEEAGLERLIGGYDNLSALDEKDGLASL